MAEINLQKALIGGIEEGALEEPPTVALMLVRKDKLAEEVMVISEANLTWFGDPRWLAIVRLKPTEPPTSDGAADQLKKMQQILEEIPKTLRSPDGPWMWPLNDNVTSAAIIKVELQRAAVGDVEGLQRPPFWRRVITQLHFCVRKGGGPYLLLLKETYGSGCAYSFARAHFQAHNLWMLAALCAIALSIGANPQADPIHRTMWEVFKILALAWGFQSVLRGRDQHTLLAVAKGDHTSKKEEASRARNKDFKPGDRSGIWVFMIFPAVAFSSLLCLSVLVAIVQLNLFLTYDWGDCVKLGCTSPQQKHGFVGFLASLGSDILLAIIWEALLALGKGLGKAAARLHNYEFSADRDALAHMLTTSIEAIGKVGVYLILGLIFVPQWTAPQPSDDDCSGVLGVGLVGTSSMFCLQRRLPLDTRRTIFVNMTFGPFCVAPFISILMKVIVPRFADWLDDLGRRTSCCPAWYEAITDGVARLLGLLFTYDGDTVGCLKYVAKGFPFPKQFEKKAASLKDLVNPEGSSVAAALQDDGGEEDRKLICESLQQGMLKPFEALDEMLELKLTFLWVMLFAPVNLFGVFPTLFARLLETQSDLWKLLFVRRRPFPETARVCHRTQVNMSYVTLSCAVVWSAALSLIVYNDGLYKWVA